MSTALTPVERKLKTMRDDLRGVLVANQDKFKDVLPAYMDINRLIGIALNATLHNPKLLDCTIASVALSMMQSSQTGLEPDGYNAHLIPYGKECTFVPDYKGLIQLALKNGVTISAHAVYDEDEFEYSFGTNEYLHHVPTEKKERGNLRCAYAIATMQGGAKTFLVATKHDIEKRRNMSQAVSEKTPWFVWEEMMWIKTAVKMLSKYIPRSVYLNNAIAVDDAIEAGIRQQPGSAIVSAVSIDSLKTDELADKFANVANGNPKSDVKEGE